MANNFYTTYLTQDPVNFTSVSTEIDKKESAADPDSVKCNHAFIRLMLKDVFKPNTEFSEVKTLSKKDGGNNNKNDNTTFTDVTYATMFNNLYTKFELTLPMQQTVDANPSTIPPRIHEVVINILVLNNNDMNTNHQCYDIKELIHPLNESDLSSLEKQLFKQFINLSSQIEDSDARVAPNAKNGKIIATKGENVTGNPNENGNKPPRGGGKSSNRRKRKMSKKRAKSVRLKKSRRKGKSRNKGKSRRKRKTRTKLKSKNNNKLKSKK